MYPIRLCVSVFPSTCLSNHRSRWLPMVICPWYLCMFNRWISWDMPWHTHIMLESLRSPNPGLGASRKMFGTWSARASFSLSTSTVVFLGSSPASLHTVPAAATGPPPSISTPPTTMIKLSSWLQGLLQLSMFQATPSLFFSSVLALSVLRTRQQGGFYLKKYF